MSGQGLLRALLAVVLGLLGAAVLAPAPAYACSCAGLPLAELVDPDDVVVRGTVTDRDTVGIPGLLRSSDDEVAYRVDVERVYQGVSGPESVVHSVASGASCGLEVDVGGDYVLAVSPRDGRLHGSLCGATARADAAYVAEVEALLGPGTPPDPTVAAPETASYSAGWVLGGAGLLTLVAAALLVGRVRARPLP